MYVLYLIFIVVFYNQHYNLTNFSFLLLMMKQSGLDEALITCFYSSVGCASVLLLYSEI